MKVFDGTEEHTANLAIFASCVGIFANLLLTAVKLLVGFSSKSAALVADGYHSMSDIISSALVVVGLKIAEKPADAEHPYGHGKAEAIAAKLVSLILIGIGGWTAYKGVTAIHGNTRKVLPGTAAAIVAFLSIVMKEALYRYKVLVGRRTGSRALVAEAWHHRSDAFSSLVSLVAVVGAQLGGSSWAFLDNLGAVIIGCVILWTGSALFLESSDELLDRVVTGAPRRFLIEQGASVDGVELVEKVFIRKSGLDLLVDIHVQVDPALSVREGHRIGHKVKRRIMRTMPAVKSVLVHVEPYYSNSGDDSNESE